MINLAPQEGDMVQINILKDIPGADPLYADYGRITEVDEAFCWIRHHPTKQKLIRWHKNPDYKVVSADNDNDSE